MAKILVHTAFHLNLPNGTTTPRYKAGIHEVSDEVADHWFTQNFADRVADEPETLTEESDDDTDTIEDDDSAGTDASDEGEESESDDEDAELESSSDEDAPDEDPDETPVETKQRGRRGRGR